MVSTMLIGALACQRSPTAQSLHSGQEEAWYSIGEIGALPNFCVSALRKKSTYRENVSMNRKHQHSLALVNFQYTTVRSHNVNAALYQRIKNGASTRQG